MEQLYYKYWGKAARNNEQGGLPHHLLPYHSLDVAAVAWELLSPERTLISDIAELLNTDVNELRKFIVFSVCLHDLGKFSSAFQALYGHENLYQANSRLPYDSSDYRHDMLGHYFFEQLYGKCGKIESLSINIQKALLKLFNCSFGHHGKPVSKSKMKGEKHYCEQHNVDTAKEFVEDVSTLLDFELPIELVTSQQWKDYFGQISWHITGVITLSDWLGSNTDYFPYETQVMPLSEYWIKAINNAKNAVKETDLGKAFKPSQFTSVKEVFGFNPTPLQQWAEQVELNEKPQLFILEDITGSGKTEAALTLTHRLMAGGVADGFYFGLPTMATSNAMFQRVSSHYLKMYEGRQQPSILLAHSAREMNEDFQKAKYTLHDNENNYSDEDESASAYCNYWFADTRKKALLASVGVGTIDQALLATLPKKHQSIRFLGLHRKVLIFDEVHSADEYMFELLSALLKMHLHHGGSAILLTATLSLQKREQLCRLWSSSEDVFSENAKLTSRSNFPLATHMALDNFPVEVPLASRDEVSRTVKVNFLDNVTSVIEKLISASNARQCAVWVRNSVDDALEAYTELVDQLGDEKVILFHSQFILQDRQIIEKKVLEVFGKESAHASRAGMVLVATQVFQESLDADADIMVSDICPIDDLIQRAGRLHRHTRNSNMAYQAGVQDVRSGPELYIHAPKWSDNPAVDWLKKDFLNTQLIYGSPGRLWLAMKVLKGFGAYTLPQDARALIEAVYDENAQDNIPDQLLDKDVEKSGKSRNKQNKGSQAILKWRKGYSTQSHNVWLDDIDDTGTRYIERETKSVLLLRLIDGELQPWVGATKESKHAIALSTMKISVTKLDKLIKPSQEMLEEIDRFKNENRQAKYIEVWIPELDKDNQYSCIKGLFVGL